ncbi:MAG TPA: hypothetical protein VGI75_06290 [Pirellulales bacterium]
MSGTLLYYERVNPTTWVYLSSLLIIALFFKFNRLWSVRNLDLVGLILLAPGLLLLLSAGLPAVRPEQVPALQQAGYIWLFVIGGLFMIRMLLDPMMVRRPLLEPNLSAGGLAFLGAALLVFMMANVVYDAQQSDALAIAPANTPTEGTPPISGAKADNQVEDKSGNKIENSAQDNTDNNNEIKTESPPADQPLLLYGPGFPWIFDIFRLPTRLLFSGENAEPAVDQTANSQKQLQLATARTVAILSYIAVVAGMVFIGFRHFGNTRLGIAAAVLFLLLPYIAILTGRYLEMRNIGQVYHMVAAALLVWAVAAYRRPVISGILLGLAIGIFYYPIFLLPLWCSFYWQRGIMRFASGVVAMLLLLVAVLYFRPYGSFGADLQQMFGALLPRMNKSLLQGFWGLPFNDPVYRIPVLVAFVAMCITLAFWPAQKNLGTLLSCSAAVMLGVQFWHALGGGQLLAWYLPLLLLTIFRPNLEDRIALSVLNQWSFARRNGKLPPIPAEQAAQT